jgi:hypothetical protein
MRTALLSSRTAIFALPGCSSCIPSRPPPPHCFTTLWQPLLHGEERPGGDAEWADLVVRHVNGAGPHRHAHDRVRRARGPAIGAGGRRGRRGAGVTGGKRLGHRGHGGVPEEGRRPRPASRACVEAIEPAVRRGKAGACARLDGAAPGQPCWRWASPAGHACGQHVPARAWPRTRPAASHPLREGRAPARAAARHQSRPRAGRPARARRRPPMPGCCPAPRSRADPAT